MFSHLWGSVSTYFHGIFAQLAPWGVKACLPCPRGVKTWFSLPLTPQPNGIGTGIRIKDFWLELESGVESTENWLESELESDFCVNLESESHMGGNRASLVDKG